MVEGIYLFKNAANFYFGHIVGREVMFYRTAEELTPIDKKWYALNVYEASGYTIDYIADVRLTRW